MEGVNIPLGGERKRQRSVSSSSSSGGSDMSPPLSPMSPTSFDYHHHLMHHRTSHGHVLGPADQNAASNAHSNGTNGNGNSNGNSKTKDAYASRPAPKYHRAPSPDRPFLCTLPPTCSQPGTSQAFASQADLDAHQDRLHRWMCRVPIRDKPGRVGEGEPVLILPEQFAGRGPRGGTHGQRWRECGKVFPEERLLDLHYTETHDPIARERLQRGEKIFECFLPPEQCRKVFLTPKKRRHHLIDKHRYPIGYFFAITNHGLNRLAREEGPAASLIRPRRDYKPPIEPDSAGMRRASIGDDPTAAGVGAGVGTGAGTGGSPTLVRRSSIRRNSTGQPHHAHLPPPSHHLAPPHPPDDMDIDDLTSKMSSLESSLAFVPRNVRRAAARGRTTRAAMEVG